MNSTKADRSSDRTEGACGLHDECGFSLAEFIISSVILLLLAAAVFTMLRDTQRAASYQTEVQAVIENTRIGLDTVSRILQQTGNDPLNTGFSGLTIVSSTEARVLSDLTGSAAPSYPDKGDPDGDTNDANEDVSIRYNATAKTLELVPQGGAAQAIASHITAFSMQFFDASGGSTSVGADVRKVTVSITGATSVPNPQTGQRFSVQLGSDIQLATRQ